jgi:hypothetical protein
MDTSSPPGDAIPRPKSSWLRPAFAAVVVVALLVAGIVGLVALPEVSPTSIEYSAIAPATLVVRTVCGPPPNSSSDLAKVVETSTQVQVFAECRSPRLGSGPAVGYGYFFTIQLGAPLGSRSVVDGLGQPAGQCSQVGCGAPSAT